VLPYSCNHHLSIADFFCKAREKNDGIDSTNRRINEIVLEKRKITADTALRLAKFFGTSAVFWIGLQLQYYLNVAADKLGERREKEV
jgi:addiction module HigA family antidote